MGLGGHCGFWSDDRRAAPAHLAAGVGLPRRGGGCWAGRGALCTEPLGVFALASGWWNYWYGQIVAANSQGLELVRTKLVPLCPLQLALCSLSMAAARFPPNGGWRRPASGAPAGFYEGLINI